MPQALSERGERSRALTAVQTPQTVHQDGVVSDRVGGLHDPTEKLVVPRGGQGELGPHRFLLRSGVSVPGSLEVEERTVAVGEGHLLTVAPGRPCGRQRGPGVDIAVDGTPRPAVGLNRTSGRNQT